MLEELGINKELEELSKKVEEELKEQFDEIERIKEINSLKVLKAFQTSNLQEMHLISSTGYGIDEAGRNKIEEIYAKVFKAEDSLVRAQFISGTHALSITLSALLRPNDTMISITGAPYDTLQTVIGSGKEISDSSLKAYRIKYEQIELIDNDFDIKLIQNRLKKQDVKLVEIQRSRGYSTRKSLTIDKIERAIKAIREVNKEVIIMVEVVASSVKTAVFASKILEKLGYNVEPKADEIRADIVQTIQLDSEENLVKFCQGIQKGSPIDSNVIPYPSEMGGYEDKVIMAAGTFTEGSTIELSCDGPIRPPYIAYMQGGLTYEYGKFGILKAIKEMEKGD